MPHHDVREASFSKETKSTHGGQKYDEDAADSQQGDEIRDTAGHTSNYSASDTLLFSGQS